MRKTAIIVPCYNEGGRLGVREFVEWTATNRDTHFIFVDDGSTDDTLEKLDAICRDSPAQCRRIALPRNGGKAEAVRAGFLEAMKSDFGNIGYWDADLATPLDAIPRLCDILDRPGVSMAIGSRVKLLGRKIERRAARHYLGRVFATAASIVLRLPVYDTQCGAKLFRRCRELEAVFGKPFSVNWTFDVEILARFVMLERFGGAASLRSTCVECPLDEWVDVPGSKIRPIHFLVGMVELLKILHFLRAPGAERRFRDLSAGAAPARPGA